MNEIKVTEIESKELTAQEKKALAKAEADREKAITKAVKLFDKAMEKVEGSAWELCELVYKTLNADNFKELFGKKETYAKAIGQSPSTISKYEKVYARKVELETATQDGLLEELPSFSVGQLTEFGSLEVEETVDAIIEKNIKTTDTIKVIRKKIKEYKAGDPIEAEETEPTEETEATEETTGAKTLVINYGDETIQIMSDDERYAKIVELLGL